MEDMAENPAHTLGGGGEIDPALRNGGMMSEMLQGVPNGIPWGGFHVV
jgi:hypothetical protein